MNNQEKQKAVHLLILICYTIFSCALTGESLLLGWETWATVLLPAGVIAGWTLHIRNRLPMAVRLDIYTVLMMLIFFFFGIHETSMFDLAPVMITVMVLYSFTEKYSTIKICMITYYLTMGYDLFLYMDGFAEEALLSDTRLFLHLVLVYMAGRLLKIMGQSRVKERKTTEDMIVRLESMNRRTEDFLANVSHELRTPINVVTGITAVMLKNEEDTEKKRDIRAIQMAGQRLFDQIEDILDYTEIDNCKMTVSEEAYMISSIVNDVISENQMLEREYLPELIFDLDAAMPAVFLGDGKKVKKILRHLVRNAVKFTKNGGVCVRIRTLPKDYGVNLCITVSDTGNGISEGELDKIAEGFYQTDGGRSRSAGGLGLGLSIVAGMVSCMEGFMQIGSETGKGTVVSASIPQKVADYRPMIALNNRERLCLACFLKPEKYEVPEVRDYYNETIVHMVESLDVSMYRVFQMDELKSLTGACRITHLFTGAEEYEENSEWFETLAGEVRVIVVADENFTPVPGTGTKLLKKPFYCLPVANLLNAEAEQDENRFEKKRMICSNVKILVVDDEPMNLMVAEGIFKEYEMQVRAVYSGMEALELCKKEEFDLIFLDHMMPEMDGVETLKKLRRVFAETGRSATVIAFTANAVSGAREMFFREGFDEFVSKPIEMVELERVLRNVLPDSMIRFVDRDYKAESSERQTSELHADAQEKPNEHVDGNKAVLLEQAGIHIRSGLQYCVNDMAFYRELLLKFAGDAGKKQEDMAGFFAREDWENYRIMVHALKSTARMIGADELSGLAKGLEDVVKNGETAYIREHHKELLARYRDTEQSIWRAFGEEGNSGEEADGDKHAEQEISATELAQKLEEIKESLGTFEAEKAGAQIGELNCFMYEGNSVADLLKEVLQDVDDFEIAAALEKVKALVCRIKGGDA